MPQESLPCLVPGAAQPDPGNWPPGFRAGRPHPESEQPAPGRPACDGCHKRHCRPTYDRHQGLEIRSRRAVAITVDPAGNGLRKSGQGMGLREQSQQDDGVGPGERGYGGRGALGINHFGQRTELSPVCGQPRKNAAGRLLIAGFRAGKREKAVSAVHASVLLPSQAEPGSRPPLGSSSDFMAWAAARLIPASCSSKGGPRNVMAASLPEELS